MGALERRDFLRVAALGGLTGLVTACSFKGSGSTGPTGAPPSRPASGSSGAAGAPGAADWNGLRRGLHGELVRPGDAGYDTARLAFNPRFDGVRPAGVAFCATPEDVRECLRFAQRYGVAVTARGGGHSYAGWSIGPGLVVDVTRMHAVAADTGSGTATVGAGARLLDVYAGLAAHGVTVPAGSCPTVGVAGQTLGGGNGVTARAYGLTSDNVVSVEVVTADGRILTCDGRQSSDLYWACRGGGGGNFGVVTSFRFRTHPAPEVALCFLGWPWDRAPQVVRAWQSWAPGAPDRLWSNCHLLANPAGQGPKVTVGGLYLGPRSDLERLLDGLRRAVGAEPSSQIVETTSYVHAMMVEAGCSKLTVAQCHLPWQVAGGRLRREAEAAKSDFFTRPLTDAAIATITRAAERRRALGSGGDGGIALDALGGAINRVRPDETAFVHRDGLFVAQYTTTWADGAPAADVQQHLTWLRGFHAAMRPHASGQAYQNYADPELTGWQRAYYGANYERLVRVKAAYDPDRLFRLPQGIPPR